MKRLFFSLMIAGLSLTATASNSPFNETLKNILTAEDAAVELEDNLNAVILFEVDEEGSVKIINVLSANKNLHTVLAEKLDGKKYDGFEAGTIYSIKVKLLNL